VVLHDYALYKSTFTLLYFTLRASASDLLLCTINLCSLSRTHRDLLLSTKFADACSFLDYLHFKWPLPLSAIDYSMVGIVDDTETLHSSSRPS